MTQINTTQTLPFVAFACFCTLDMTPPSMLVRPNHHTYWSSPHFTNKYQNTLQNEILDF